MAVTNYKYAGTAESVNANANDWVNPNYAKADDTSYASSVVDKHYSTDYLILTNFGFSSSDIPAGSTINGIEFVVSRYASSSAVKEFNLRLRYSGANVGSNMGSANGWPTSIGEATYGGSTNLCGWTAASQDKIVSSTFGILIDAYDSSSGEPDLNCYVDYIKIRVYYTEGGGSTVFLPNIMKHNFIPPLIGGY